MRRGGSGPGHETGGRVFREGEKIIVGGIRLHPLVEAEARQFVGIGPCGIIGGLGIIDLRGAVVIIMMHDPEMMLPVFWGDAVVVPVVPDGEGHARHHIEQKEAREIFALRRLIDPRGGVARLAAHHVDPLARRGVFPDKLARLLIGRPVRFRSAAQVGMNRDARPVGQRARLGRNFDKVELGSAQRGSDDDFPGRGLVNGLADREGELRVIIRVRLWLPEPTAVRLVPDFPDHAPALEMGRRRHGPAREGRAARVGMGGKTVVIELVCVIENEQGADMEFIEARQQPVIGGEIIDARLLLGLCPGQVHAYPAKARAGQHLQFAGRRICEMDIHAHAGQRIGRIGPRGLRALQRGQSPGGQKRQEKKGRNK